MSGLRKVTDVVPNVELKDSFINLVIDGDFEDFTDFYDVSRTVIYEKVTDLFQGLLIPENKTLTLTVYAKIKGMDWDSDFTLTRENRDMLIKTIIPYFESLEDFEKCSELLLLHQKLEN